MKEKAKRLSEIVCRKEKKERNDILRQKESKRLLWLEQKTERERKTKGKKPRKKFKKGDMQMEKVEERK